MHAWLHDLQHLLAHGDAAVLVTLAHVDGSAPCDAGAKMVVTRDAARRTIGGGHLEARAIDIARQLLRDGMRAPRLRRLERIALDPDAGQSCGGAVVIAFERLDVGDLGWLASLAKRLNAGQSTVRSVAFGDGTRADDVLLSDPEPGNDAPDCLLWHGVGGATLLTETIAPDEFPVVVFGAGHVGTAVVRVLTTLPCRLRWVDTRDAAFPSAPALAALAGISAGSVTIDANDTPADAVDAAPPGTAFLVMTHDHARDFALAERVLRRADYAFFGMLGSRTKRRQFEHRLAALGIDPLQIARMTCPLGVEGIAGKTPEVIAISTAAQLLRVLETRAAARRRPTAAV